MFNLVNYETNERFNNFPYIATINGNGVVGDFYPEFECDTFVSYSRFQIPFNDEYVEGKTNDIYVSDKAYNSMLRHYKLNFVDDVVL